MKRLWNVLLPVIGAIILLPLSIQAQLNRGSLTGSVKDPQSAIVPGAAISVKNEATGVVLNTVSTGAGQFSFLNIQPGAYTLSTQMAGFRTFTRPHIAVELGRNISVDVVLETGRVEQNVTVSANSDMVDTQTSDIGTTVTPEEIKDLPVSLSGDSRNPLNFVTLTPGVYGSEPGPNQDYRLHISGSVSYSNEIYVDGVPTMNTAQSGDISLDHPPLDAISEFKLINTNQSAQYGLATGIVSFGFVSGTNVYHGGIFEYLQNDALNAAGYVTDALHQKKAPLKQNEFGGTFGGPVWIPKLYNGRNKTFFFIDFTEFKYRPSSNNADLTTVPNAYRAGDFSQLLGPQLTSGGMPVVDAAGKPVYQGEIYNPLSAHSVVGPDGKTYVVRNSFPGNQIPVGTPGLSTVAHNVLQYFPTADTNALENNLFRNQFSKTDEHRMVVKIDENLSGKHSLSGSVFTGGYYNSNNGGLSLLDAIANSGPTKQFRVTYNYTHSPHLTNSLSIGFLRDINFTGPVQAGPGFAGLGITGLPSTTADRPFPSIQLGTLINPIGSETLSTAATNRFYEADNLTLSRGLHTVSIGGEVRRLQRNENSITANRFVFEQTATALNGTGFVNGNQPVVLPTGTGNPVASFLFGAVDFSRIDYPEAQGYRWTQAGAYVQDDWRVRPNLTLNLGLRYDVQVPRTEVHGYASTMDPTLPNPNAGGLPGAYTYYGAGSGRNGRTRIGNVYYLGFQPRVGFAFSPNQKTALRGGFAMVRPIANDNLENGVNGTLYSTGFSSLATISNPQDAVGSPAFYLDNGYPPNAIAQAKLDPGILVGNDNPTYIRPSAGLPPTHINWALQVQQEMPGGIIATVGYVGAHGYHYGVWSKPNQIAPSVAASYAGAAATAGMPLTEFLLLPITDHRAVAAGVKTPWSGFTAAFGPGATVGQALRPFPQYGNIDDPFNPIGSISYNALQTSVQKRLSQNLTFLVSYTFSKTMGDVDSTNAGAAGAENALFAGGFFENYYNPRENRSVTSSDIPQVVSVSYTYRLPFGKGQKFLNSNRVANAVIGGWTVAGIHQYQSGRPIHIEYDAFGGANPYFQNDGLLRPNIVRGQQLKNPSFQRSCSGPIQPTAGRQPCQFYINPAAFSIPASGQDGNSPNFISGLRMPKYYNEDISLSKRTQLYKRLNLQFQANFFNIFNRTVFSSGGNPQTFIINGAPPDLSQSSLANSNTVFGIMTAQQNGARVIQFGTRLEF
jgi:hypothetical protein